MGKLNGLFLIQIHITLRAAFERLSKQPSPSHPSREGARVSLSEVDVDGVGVIRPCLEARSTPPTLPAPPPGGQSSPTASPARAPRPSFDERDGRG